MAEDRSRLLSYASAESKPPGLLAWCWSVLATYVMVLATMALSFVVLALALLVIAVIVYS